MLPEPQNFGLYNHTLPSSSTSSVMYLFRPRRFNNQFRRNMIYNFDANFVNNAAEVVQLTQAEGRRGLVEGLLTRPDVLGCIRPAADNLSFLQLDVLSDNWTFVLVVDNDNAAHSGLRPASILGNNRIIYSGFFIDEPMNPVYHGQLTLNPDSQLIITHKTLINRLSTHGANGIQTRIDTGADVDIVMPKILTCITAEKQYAIRPEDLVDYTLADIGGNFVSSIGDVNSIDVEGGSPLNVDSTLLLPQQNLRKVVGSIVDAIDAVTMRAYGGPMYPERGLGRDTLETAIHTNLGTGSHLRHIGLQENQLITINDIVSRYSPQIQAFDAGLPSYGVADQSVNSASNMFSSLLMIVIPSILANTSMANISFFYNSYANNGQGQWRIEQFSSLLPLPDEELKMRVRSVIYELERNVFPMLKSTRGDFDIMGNFTCGGISQCTLNFMCDAMKTTDIYEVPTILGGLNNALIGNANVAVHNSLELNQLVNVITDTHADTTLDGSEEYRLQQAIDRMERLQPRFRQDEMQSPPTTLSYL